MLFAVLATFWLVVRPLRARIDGLAVAAGGVGTDSFSPQPGSADALGHIADVLSSSHDRIVETRAALEQRNRALEDHLAGIAHDLRTPLSSMHLAMEAVAAESDGPLQLEARRALADVVYLSSMVENLHQATRLRHQVDVSSGRVELADLVRRLEARYAIVGRHANVEVAASTPEQEVWARCTPALTERAVANLIQNAVEHNSEPGHVAITLSVSDAGSRFDLAVADDGPGLPDDTLASLEDETFLRDTARRRGPGLGMLITAEVARRAGWSLSYESLEPTGLRVRVQGDIDVATSERTASTTRSGTYS
jgi:signal transduction histidine kinase